MSARDEHKYLQNLLMSKCNMLPLHPSTYIVCCVCCVRVCWALETIKLILNIHKCIFYHRKICSYITKYKECRYTALPNSPDPRAETRELAAELRMRWQRHWEVQWKLLLSPFTTLLALGCLALRNLECCPSS